MKPDPDDTIVAISTPPGRGAIGIVRLSGPRALEIAGSIAEGANRGGFASGETRTMRRATLRNGGVAIDDALVAVMRKPKSYTGEDMAEFHCHGNPLVLAGVVEACMRGGARAALPGEFTRRAFLNGKLDLSQAEAVAELVEASSERAIELAMRQAGGELSRRVAGLRSLLLDILAGVEARLEFPEEELGGDAFKELLSSLSRATEECRALVDARARGMRIRNGVRVVIVGKPNAGKSSIFNRLLGSDRALVTPQKGTTRDFIEETVMLEGMAVTIVDTAGICGDHTDEAGKAGVARSRSAMERADLLLFVADASTPWTDEDREIAAGIRGRKGAIVLNKTDLPRRIELEGRTAEMAAWEIVPASALLDEGIDSIIKYINSHINSCGGGAADESAILCSAWQTDAIRRCAKGVESAREMTAGGGREELVALELKTAIDALGEISGVNVKEDLLDRIFSRFCIGK